jgi:transmembrane 9 superfamily protein 2/4
MRIKGAINIVAFLLLSFFPGYLRAFWDSLVPADYQKGSLVPLTVNVLTSHLSSLQYDYYGEEMRFCKPVQLEYKKENLGSILLGDRIQNSPFEIRMLVNETCRPLCKSILEPLNQFILSNRIKESYFHNWFLDGLPIAGIFIDPVHMTEFVSLGFPIGDSAFNALFNHYSFDFSYHYDAIRKAYHVVGARVYARSLNHPELGRLKLNISDSSNFPSPREAEVLSCVYSKNNMFLLNSTLDRPTQDQDINNGGHSDPSMSALHVTLETLDQDPRAIVYTYDVAWTEEPDVDWHHRWEHYYGYTHSKLHWMSITQSIVVIFLLAIMVAIVLIRLLRKDIARYNQSTSIEDLHDEYGWKLVHADIFRAPFKGMTLGVLIGTGTQMFLMAFVTLIVALLGITAPGNRGAILSTMVGLFVLFSYIAGYISAVFYKMIGGQHRPKNAIMTACYIPGILLCIFTVLNIMLRAQGSISAVPYSTYGALVLLWLFASLPLSIIGARKGFQREKVTLPVRTNQIPRQIPKTMFLFRSLPSYILGGILPFGTILLELYFIYNTMWFNRVYYIFGYLFSVLVLLIITSAEVSILMCYFHLCAEDYRWWWRSFFTPGFTGVYVFIYSIFYYHARLHLFQDYTSIFLFFGWAFMLSLFFFLICGAVGFFSCFWFVRKIYGSIKCD